MRKIALLLIATLLFAGVDEPYYTGAAKQICEKSVRHFVEQNAQHEYWFETFDGDFFNEKNLAHHVAVFSGDNLKIKNEYGIYHQYRYECIFRTDMYEVILVRAHKITMKTIRQTRLYAR